MRHTPAAGVRHNRQDVNHVDSDEEARAGDPGRRRLRLLVTESRGNQGRLGIEAPPNVPLFRDEARDKDRARYRLAADERVPAMVGVWRRIPATTGAGGGDGRLAANPGKPVSFQ